MKYNFPPDIKRALNKLSIIMFFIMTAAIVVAVVYDISVQAEIGHIMLLVGIYVAVVLSFFLGTIPIVKKTLKRSVENRKDKMTTSFYTINSQMDIIISLFMILERIKRVENDSSLNVRYDKLKTYIYRMKEPIIQCDQLQEMMEEPCYIDEEKLSDTIRSVNSNLYELKENITGMVSEFASVYTDGREQVYETNLQMATLVYYLSNIIPIISDLSSSSNKFSKNVILSVIKQFEDIANFSNQITDDIQKTMEDLMDESNQESLAYIIHKAHEVVKDFETFFQSMEKLKSVSGNFVDTSIAKLKDIGDIAGSIEEISETIKVISLNVSIEAANTGSTGRGFQVLARDLREFAQRTRKFAQDVKNRVQDTILTTENLKDEYMSNMHTVYEYVEEIKTSIESFEGIIVKSFGKIKDIIRTLQEFSNKISNGIKDIVGKLQYYDITSQEIDHLGLFIEKIFRKSSKELHEFRIDSILERESRFDIKKEILSTIRGIITTKNERKIYEEYLRIFGMTAEDTGDYIEEEKEQIIKEMQEDEDIIIF